MNHVANFSDLVCVERRCCATARNLSVYPQTHVTKAKCQTTRLSRSPKYVLNVIYFSHSVVLHVHNVESIRLKGGIPNARVRFFLYLQFDAQRKGTPDSFVVNIPLCKSSR